MKIKIYQINPDRDKNHVLYTRHELLEKYQGTSDIDASLYDEVFSGKVECKTLEGVYSAFNQAWPPPLHRGRALSISDIVVTEDGVYFCDSFGFKKVDFDESQTQKPENLFQIVYVEPHKAPIIAEIEENGLQRAVRGHYERVYTPDNCFYICNMNAKIEGMDGNRSYNNGEEIIAGPFVVIGQGKNHGYRSLTDEEIQRYMERFAEIEEFTQDEVADSMGIKFIPL